MNVEEMRESLRQLETQRNAALVSILPTLQAIAALDAQINLLNQMVERLQAERCPTA
jgi:hypothetical protein